ncbi:alpha/beta hydrolase fold protein [Rippkaea orientalis PCC 8801]|uniref:Alpha/beta hydrolase fold protein n=1 Tax=Rippkaea orientalis (strain PCC 8801 / RF-1) TaxID=41431 RepID=B7K182_RIPO1|nr:alpha/beta fold hydrolase [Rippkaea orientalis]ACK66277.1 alpha/beta hydrolase fold protein [Rippkaea orientalis PCC 8801]
MSTSTLLSSHSLEALTWTWQGHRINYTVKGTGQPILLIHGFGASIGHWRKNIPILAENGYRVYALDLLGFGGSAKPPLEYTLELWCEQIKDFWQVHVDQPAVFVGNSIGGLLSLMMMATYPEITKGGILINCAGGLNHRPDELNLPLRLIMGAFAKLVNSPVTGKFIFNSIRQKHRIRSTLYQVYRDRNAVTDELIDILYQPSCDAGAQQVFASVLTAPPGPSPNDLLPQVQHPLLVLWGTDDPWTPITGAKIYQERANQGQNTQFYPINKAGHCPHDETPTQVNQLILNWLNILEA